MTGYVYLPNNNNLIVNKLSGNVVTYNNEILTNELGETINGIADYMSYAIVGDNTQIIGNVFDNSEVISDAKTAMINTIDTSCNNEILAGFNSSADGTSKLYDFALENQVNMNVLLGKIGLAQIAGTPLTNVSYYGKGEACHGYTIAQFSRLCEDAEIFKINRIEAYKNAKTQINNGTTLEEINAVTWVDYVTPVLVTSITLDKTSVSPIVGGIIQVTAIVLPVNTTNSTLSWSSTDVTIATVDQTGLITGVKVGSTTITVASTDSSNISQAISITVSATA